ncbi:hypothetical protein [Stenotrophomonas phage BUCT555]|nr:hypothetical protein [Stenotrophomonas phage BUCT555]
MYEVTYTHPLDGKWTELYDSESEALEAISDAESTGCVTTGPKWIGP